MPERRQTKNFFRLNRGLNTESNEISFPDGYTTDEANYELLPDGSRKRRRGCARESSGTLKTTGDTITTTQKHRSYRWRGVNGDPDKNFIVHQVGEKLYFTDDAELISTTYHTTVVDLTAYKIDTTDTTAEMANEPVSFTQGRGHLFVCSRKVRPLFIEYDATGDEFNVRTIVMTIRDFHGIDDGRAVDLQPTDASPGPADHIYNLRNRGWKSTDYETYRTNQAKYPAKNMLWHRGYRRATNVSFSDLDGIQQFDDAKLVAEFFGNASAPQGSLFLNPLDTSYATVTSGEQAAVAISTWDFTTGDPAAGGVVTFTTVGNHLITNGDEVSFEGVLGTYNGAWFGYYWKFLFQKYVATVTSGTTFTVPVSAQADFVSWNNQYLSLGTLSGAEVLLKSDGKTLTDGPTAIEYHAGRLFYAGIPDSEWADIVLFSEIAQKQNGYGKCHMRADPTDPNINSLTGADGGTIVIPNLGAVKDMLSVRNSLLIFSDQGIWEIGGGQRGFFTADGYSVKKISNAECSSQFSPITFENIAMFTGPKGIFQVSPNEFTGLLEAQNLSETLIQTLWNDIPSVNQAVVQSVYDDALKRVYFLYGDSGLAGSTDNINQYANALVLDLRVQAWYKFTFNVTPTAGILTAYSITESDSADANKKIKWTAQATNNLDTCDLDQADYLDYNGAESPLPYMVTGWDALDDFQKRKQAPVITVHQKKTETGFTATGNGLDPVNESSCLMTGYWDWTDNSVSGKVGSQNQVYRHVRGYQPTGAADTFDDGYPVVTTRNKVRGRGRVLQLRFDGEATKDTHLLGYSTNYKISRAI